jgi:hypothetical protein
MQLLDFGVLGDAGVATMPLAGLEQSERFLLVFGVDAPLLGARDDHRRVVGVELLLRALGHGHPHWTPQG